MNCPKCGAEYSEGAKFCSKCGESLAVLISEPVPNVATPVVDTPVVPETPKEAAIPAQANTADAPKANNTMIIVLIIALVAIIGAAGTGWYMWNKDGSAPAAPSSVSAPQKAAGQPAADGGMPAQPSTPAQPAGMPQVDENGMPIKQPGAAGQPDVGAALGQQPGAPAPQPGVDVQQPPMQEQPGAKVPQSGMQGQPRTNAQQQDVMPQPMPQEARKRRAAGDNPAPRRNVRMEGSIDDQYHQRAASECPAGGSGFFCREKVRYQLCKNRWSASPPPGQSMCQKSN